MPKRVLMTLLIAALGATALPAAADLPLDKITVADLPPAHPYRLYYTDVAINHLPDGKMTLIDGRSLKVEGMVSTGMFGQTTLSPDRSELYAVTTYYSKLNRGERIEEILIYDANTLKLKEEIAYPARHAQALPYRGTLRTSADGRFIYVQNATPATSISIVDRKAGKMVAEIATPGCYIVYPAQTTQRLSTLCGDGTMLTISLDENGLPIGKQKSARFFDPEEDALFVSAAQDGDRYHFVSFKGNLVTVDVSGEKAKPEAAWPLASKVEQGQGWRPGGYQPVALHRDSQTLYVALHPKAYEGSHKDPAREVWVYDLSEKRRLARVKVPETTGLAVSQGAAPRLFAYDTGKAAITAFDGGRKLKQVASKAGFGDTPTQLETQ